MKAIRKEYARPFILEATKLTRLVEVIHDCLGSNSSPVRKDKFEVFLCGNRVEEVTTLEEVLQLENSRGNAIKRLVLTSSASSHPGAGSENQVQVDFDSRSQSRSPSGSTTTTAKILLAFGVIPPVGRVGLCQMSKSKLTARAFMTSANVAPLV